MKLKPGPVLCALLIIISLSGCGGDRGGLLVTKADYDAALAKWRAQAIASYKMSVALEAGEVILPVLSGDWTLVVSDGGNKVEVLSRPPGVPYQDPPNSEDLSYLTVENQFEIIGGWFGKVVPEGTTRRATFDPALGYPTLVEDKFRSTGDTYYPGGLGGTSFVVHSLEIVGNSAPKTPAPETSTP